MFKRALISDHQDVVMSAAQITNTERKKGGGPVKVLANDNHRTPVNQRKECAIFTGISATGICYIFNLHQAKKKKTRKKTKKGKQSVGNQLTKDLDQPEKQTD